MEAEITVTFKKSLPDDIVAVLRKRFGESSDIEETANLTSLRGIRRFIEQVRFARTSNSAVRLYFRTERQVVKIHIASVAHLSVKAIRREIESEIAEMGRLAKSCKNRVKSLAGTISAEGAELYEVSLRSLVDKMKLRAKEHIAPKVAVPLATAIAVYSVRSPAPDVARAASNAAIALIVAVLFILFDAFTRTSAIAYSEV
ncbi:hypothetical protein AB1286_08565 [Trinickia sp. NRRL B-1857]|uniref:hypothetical protein n=1 Tax=Trinickia sp. NRRL B-1857 TaxID=3162879 RepID=UPI003D2E5B2F